MAEDRGELNSVRHATRLAHLTRGVLILALGVALAGSAGCGSLMYVFGGRGYRQFVTPYRDELPVRPEWQRFVEENWAREARVHLDALGLSPETPVTLEFVAAHYYRQEKHTQLVAMVRPPEGSIRSPRGVFDVVWRKSGGASSKKPWAVLPPVLPPPPLHPATQPSARVVP